MRQRSAPKPFSPLMPCSVYWPLRHMSHSPAAQAGQGTGSGCRTMPTTMVAGREAAVRRRFAHAAERLVAEDQPLVAGRRFAVVARDDLAVGAADAERERLDQDRAFAGGGSGTSRSSTEFGLGGWTVIARKGTPWMMVSRPTDDAGTRRKVPSLPA